MNKETMRRGEFFTDFADMDRRIDSEAEVFLADAIASALKKATVIDVSAMWYDRPFGENASRFLTVMDKNGCEYKLGYYCNIVRVSDTAVACSYTNRPETLSQATMQSMYVFRFTNNKNLCKFLTTISSCR